MLGLLHILRCFEADWIPGMIFMDLGNAYYSLAIMRNKYWKHNEQNMNIFVFYRHLNDRAYVKKFILVY